MGALPSAPVVPVVRPKGVAAVVHDEGGVVCGGGVILGGSGVVLGGNGVVGRAAAAVQSVWLSSQPLSNHRSHPIDLIQLIIQSACPIDLLTY